MHALNACHVKPKWKYSYVRELTWHWRDSIPEMNKCLLSIIYSIEYLVKSIEKVKMNSWSRVLFDPSLSGQWYHLLSFNILLRYCHSLLFIFYFPFPFYLFFYHTIHPDYILPSQFSTTSTPLSLPLTLYKDHCHSSEHFCHLGLSNRKLCEIWMPLLSLPFYFFH